MKATDWDEYYNNPSGFSKYTRPYTQNWLIRQINLYSNERSLSIAEFGGGNSCFHDAILEQCLVKSYTIFDNNTVGVKKFKEKYSANNVSKAVNCNLLSEDVKESRSHDIVFSVGLIEHFDQVGTQEVVKKHFDAVKPGGVVILTAPTSTLLYNVIRKSAEAMNIWKFHDERALKPQEMYDCVNRFGNIIDEKMLWAIGLTQYALVVKSYE